MKTRLLVGKRPLLVYMQVGKCFWTSVKSSNLLVSKINVAHSLVYPINAIMD